MGARPFHLAWFLNGLKAYSWNGPFSGPGGRHTMSADLYIDFARSLERSCFDYLLLEDSSFVPNQFGNSMETYLSKAFMVPKYDPSVFGSLLPQFTTHLGVATTLSTSEYQPYMLARLIATMDHASAGRSAWNMVTGSSDLAAQNYGTDGLFPHDERYTRADEFCDAVFQLWDSWAADAIVEDRAAGVYADHTKVKVVDFVGKYFKTRGPLNVPRSPQDRPVTVQAGASPVGRRFAAKWADTVIGYAPDVAGMKEYRDSVRSYAAAQGRDPDSVKVLFLVSPLIAASDAEARAALEADRAARLVDPVEEMAMMGFTTNVDFSRLDLDRPVTDQVEHLHTNGHQSVMDTFVARAGTRTLRQMLVADTAPVVAGSPDTVAAQLDEMMQEVGGDGLLFSMEDMTRHAWATVTDGLVPALQRRGLVRREYTHKTLRENLFEF
ncbi:NtaA/DmoA family FMN-dependent monooxygenase [Nocardioides sp. AN3]